MKKLILLACFALLPAMVQAKPYLNIQELKTPKGITVWYVQDKTVPVIAMKFSMRGGTQLDPAGKDGVGNLLTTLFDEGAGQRNAEEFQDALDQHGIAVGFDIGRDEFSGALKTTVQHRDLAFALLDDALNFTKFDADAVERMRQAILSEQRQQMTDPGFLGSKALFSALFGDDVYARLTIGTPESVASITVDDLKNQKGKLFCRDHLKIGVAGDLDVAALTTAIDRIFSEWPSCNYNVDDAVMNLKEAGKTIPVEWDGAQSIVLMAQPGLKRQDKDWWAARILDFALGGGEFSSRLMDEVRVKRGLTYGISSSIAPLDRAPLWMIQAGVDPTRVDDTIRITKEVWDAVARNGLKPSEIKAAQDYLIGSLPLALTSTDMIAAILLQLQEDKLPKDTLDRRAKEIQAVTAKDIKRVAKTRLHADALTIVTVGPKKEQHHEPSQPVAPVAKPAQ